MHKSWDSQTIINEMEQAFQDKIPMDSSTELLMACGNKLVAPKLHSGQELSGLMLHKIFKSKAVYVRPSDDLACKLDNTDSEDSDMELGEHDNRSASNDLSMATRGRNSRSHRPVCVSTRARANQPPPQVPSAQPPPQVPIDLESENSVSQSALVRHNYDTYLSITGAMPDLSSDEEVNKAILASLESHPMTERDTSAQGVLLGLASKMNSHQKCRFNINRSAVLDGAIRGFKRLSYNPTFQMSIKFSDDLGVDEEAVDLGGPRRKFLRLLMEALACSQMFEGREGKANLALESSDRPSLRWRRLPILTFMPRSKRCQNVHLLMNCNRQQNHLQIIWQMLGV
ncbi:uncharacterized protein [Paralichthys olivaceus]|uniref:uncharacterized protein isoform X2 n=1 Tax=Paralichthys olivaceus TaxID=8255 RepID=UPI003752043A